MSSKIVIIGAGCASTRRARAATRPRPSRPLPASTILIPDPGGAYGPVPAAPGGTVRVITAGMPNLADHPPRFAALAAAAAAVVLDRARASRRAATATR